MAGVIRSASLAAFALALPLALSACGGDADVAAGGDATVIPAAALNPKVAAEAAKDAKLSAALASQKSPFETAKAAMDDVKLDELADNGNAWALHDRAVKRLASDDYVVQQAGFQDMEIAQEKGLPAAQFWVGERMAYGRDGYKLQPSSGLRLMEKAASAGNIEAIMEVAAMYVADAYMHDNRKARDWYKRGADLGSEDARKAMEQMDAAAGGNPLAP